MCEFDVFLDGEKVFEEAVYLKRENGNVLARDILGNEKELGDVVVEEINVSSEKLLLTSK
ncbi:hypothetical protein AKJ37_06950 [candidate division MSBL1 archaeon SCGC-AAA259I09]|uniref:Uncharacterized protein n=4 Tax=candidate division MSBL1 TaxID=215777 RepID=A0A133UM98_9EURY|nr:hypothetical protein AKJ62_02875 [candidate division MSBL1 archaeon SCGC-AAA259D14]KXA94445.1 hypothetical protein AKJ36_02870 [candidate division MSBL1 archaeon SCGC-AAA259I07]KXA95287.1 hypothetical protein AKJ37_06950 [candidate division MSBL1 archaeon SCGC-AAA259I09]KXB00863.1 hypothetical protein AKJ40_00010 [candidate division MSBL1 archaeon SCGC-AAA259M10]